MRKRGKTKQILVLLASAILLGCGDKGHVNIVSTNNSYLCLNEDNLHFYSSRTADEMTVDGLKDMIDHYVKIATVSIPVKRLRKFRKINLQPGEGRVVSFTLTQEDLGLWNKNMKFVVEPGEFEILIGSSAEDIRI
ncbi:MAG: fibronectin type III-like domain-contianing protein [Bacteroidota bacterium]|nr:fibronectin type III-like domain-contianing protein [Bacteroidota bacterium]